jgi:hypothetical protein
MVLMAAMIGQTAVDGPTTGPVLSEQSKQAQARALAEFRANEHTIKPRLIAYYQLENERLGYRVRTVNTATARVLTTISGMPDFENTGRIGGFASVPLTGNPTSPTLPELQRMNFLMKGHLRDSKTLNRQADRLYWNEYPIRYRLAGWGVR